MHVRIDEFVEKSEEENKKEPKDYKRFIYYEPDTLPNIFNNKETSPPEPSRVTELQEVQTRSQGPKSHSEATELRPTESEGPKP